MVTNEMVEAACRATGKVDRADTCLYPSAMRAALEAALAASPLQAAVDTAASVMRGSEYVGGPTEREAWRTAYAALSAVETQHAGQGAKRVDHP